MESDAIGFKNDIIWDIWEAFLGQIAFRALFGRKKRALIVLKGFFSGTPSIILEKLQFSPPESLPILFWFSLYTVFFLWYQIRIRVFFWFYWIIGNIFFMYSWITGNISQIFYFTWRIFLYFISADHLRRIKILIQKILTLKYCSRLTEDV